MERLGRAPDHLGGVYGTRRERELVGIETSEVEQVRDEALETTGFGADDLGGALLLVAALDGAVGDGFRVTADRGERGPQVVGDAQEEPALEAPRRFELRGHTVQRARQPGQLVVGMAAEVDARRQVPARD